MLTDEVRRRLESLNRQGLPATPMPAQRSPRSAAQTSHALVDLVPGAEHDTSSGPCFRVRQPLSAFWRSGSAAIVSLAREWSGEAQRTDEPELAQLAAHFPQGCVFLDIETCGFAGSMTFLIGLVWQPDGELLVDQLLARNYAEEKAILQTLGEVMSGCRALATFNGKAFDWPMIQDRATIHRLPLGRQSLPREPDFTHCDLLQHARRRWKGLLPDCKLQTLERHVCRRCRRGDIPGAEIPAAYHEFVRTGDARRIKTILEHNALDLITLVQISLRLCGPR